MRPLSKTHAAVCGTTYAPRPPIGGKPGGGVFNPSQNECQLGFHHGNGRLSPLARGEAAVWGWGSPGNRSCSSVSLRPT